MEDKKEHNYQQQQQQHQPAAYTEAIKMNDVEGLDDDYEESNDQLQNQQPHDQQLQQPQDQQQQSIQSIATQAAAAMAAAMAAQQLLASAAAICGLDLASLTNFAALAAGPASQTGMSASSGPQTAEQLMAAAVAAASFLSHNHLGVPEDLTINQQQGLAAVLAASSAPSATAGGSPTANGNNGLVGVNNTSFINYHNSSSNSSTPAPVSTPSSSHLYQTSSSTSTSPLGGLMAAAAAASASGAGGLGGNGGPGNMSAAAAANQAILLAQVAAIKQQQQQQQQQQQLAASTNHLNQHLNSLQLPLTLANSINQNNQLQAQSQNHQQLQHLQHQRQQQQQHNNTNNNHHSQTQSNHHNHHNQNNHHSSHNNNNNHHQNHHNQHSHHNHHHHTTTRHLLGGHHHHSSIQTQQQLLATKGYNPLAVVVGSGQQTEILTPTHLRKAKLMFFYVRYPNSSTLKECFRDVRFNKNNTAQLVKWFSNFREFYYIQMEKFARDAIADERIQCKEDIVVSYDHELINQLNNHYNKNRHIELPEVFRQVVEETLRHFFDSIHTKKDQEQSWKKAIYKLIARLDQEVPEYFKTDSFNEHLE